MASKSKGMRGTAFMPQGAPPQEPPINDNDADDAPLSYDNTSRDSKGRYPASLNVGGTHPAKKHPGARHVKD